MDGTKIQNVCWEFLVFGFFKFYAYLFKEHADII